MRYPPTIRETVTIAINDRRYVQEGKFIRCYWIDQKEETPLFTIALANEDDANMLMDDLYYGEYDGG